MNISKIIAILMVAGSMSWTETASLEASTLIKKKKKNPKKNRAKKAKGRKTKKKSFKENKKRFNRGSFKKETDGIGGGSLTGGGAVLPEQKQEPEDKKTSENSKNPNTLDQESVFAGGNDPNQSGNPKSLIKAPLPELLDKKKAAENLSSSTSDTSGKNLNNSAIVSPVQKAGGGRLASSSLTLSKHVTSVSGKAEAEKKVPVGREPQDQHVSNGAEETGGSMMQPNKNNDTNSLDQLDQSSRLWPLQKWVQELIESGLVEDERGKKEEVLRSTREFTPERAFVIDKSKDPVVVFDSVFSQLEDTIDSMITEGKETLEINNIQKNEVFQLQELIEYRNKAEEIKMAYEKSFVVMDIFDIAFLFKTYLEQEMADIQKSEKSGGGDEKKEELSAEYGNIDKDYGDVLQDQFDVESETNEEDEESKRERIHKEIVLSAEYGNIDKYYGDVLQDQSDVESETNEEDEESKRERIHKEIVEGRLEERQIAIVEKTMNWFREGGMRDFQSRCNKALKEIKSENLDGMDILWGGGDRVGASHNKGVWMKVEEWVVLAEELVTIISENLYKIRENLYKEGGGNRGKGEHWENLHESLDCISDLNYMLKQKFQQKMGEEIE